MEERAAGWHLHVADYCQYTTLLRSQSCIKRYSAHALKKRDPTCCQPPQAPARNRRRWLTRALAQVSRRPLARLDFPRPSRPDSGPSPAAVARSEASQATMGEGIAKSFGVANRQHSETGPVAKTDQPILFCTRSWRAKPIK